MFAVLFTTKNTVYLFKEQFIKTGVFNPLKAACFWRFLYALCFLPCLLMFLLSKENQTYNGIFVNVWGGGGNKKQKNKKTNN